MLGRGEEEGEGGGRAGGGKKRGRGKKRGEGEEGLCANSTLHLCPMFSYKPECHKISPIASLGFISLAKIFLSPLLAAVETCLQSCQRVLFTAPM